VPYDDNDVKLRGHVRRLNESYTNGEHDPDTIIALRCERFPALILVGFKPHPGGKTDFPTAIKSLVALRHVDFPKPWGEGPENESLADAVLAELLRRRVSPIDGDPLIRDYYAGAITRAEARAARLPDDPVLRAARIVWLFATSEESITDARRVAVTSQSTRKRITSKLMSELATALILRAVADDRARVDQIRRYLRHAFSKSVFNEKWDPTGRSTDRLVEAALMEIGTAIASGRTEPGPSSLELAVRAAFVLVVSGRLSADRGTSGNDQPDRRTPGEVLEVMRRSPHGVRQLGQALTDFASHSAMRAVDEHGHIRLAADGSELLISDIYLRHQFPPPGKVRASHPGETPGDAYKRAVEDMTNAFHKLDESYNVLASVKVEDGRSLVDERGVDKDLTSRWRDLLRQVDEELVIWSRAYRRKFGIAPATVIEADIEAEMDKDDPYGEADDTDEET